MNYSKYLLHLSNFDYSSIDIDVQQEFIKNLGPAYSDIERSYKQYLCQRLFSKKITRVVWFVISFCGLMFHIPFIFFRTLFRRKGIIRKADAICSFGSMKEVVPQEFISKYKIDYKAWNTGSELMMSDIKFVLKVLTQTRSLYLTYKSAILISQYSYMITHYQPRAIAVFGEFSCVSSIRTAYCESRGVLHINIMHGERFFIISDSYFRFHECYVWFEEYKRIFIDMYAEESQFIIARPMSLSFDPSLYYRENESADYKYYIQGDDESELKSIAASLQTLKNKGYKVKCRLHPRYSHLKIVSNYIDNSMIEMPQDMSILESISNTKSVIAIDSTVLLQASCVGKSVIIDNISNPRRFEYLLKARYVMIERPHLLLSDHLLTVQNKS